MLTLTTLVSLGCITSVRTPLSTDAQPDESVPEQSSKQEAASTKEDPTAEPTSCVSGESHPLAEGIAEEFDVGYQEVIDWFCQGNTFDDILLALQTSEMTEDAPEELLAMLDDMTWDEIWDQLEITAPEGSQ